MRTVIVIWIAICHPSILWAQTPLSVEQCLDAIARYEMAFYGKAVTIRPINQVAFENEEAQISISDDGSFFRVFHTFAMGERLQRVEACVVENQLIEAIEIKASAQSKPYISMSGMLEFDFHCASVRKLGSYLCGVSPRDGKRFSELLNYEQTTLTCELVDLDGHDGPLQKLVAQHPQFGEYSFWFTLGNRPLLKQIRILKQTGNFILHSVHQGPTTVGAPQYVEPRPDKKLQAQLEAEAARAPRESEWEIVVGPIEYEVFNDGTARPKSLDIKSTLGYRGRSGMTLLTGEQVIEVHTFRCADPDVAQFEKVKVHDGMPVQVAGQIGAAYEFRGGKIVRMVDVDSVARMDGIRYRKPATRSWPIVILVLIGAVALTILLRNRLRRH